MSMAPLDTALIAPLVPILLRTMGFISGCTWTNASQSRRIVPSAFPVPPMRISSAAACNDIMAMAAKDTTTKLRRTPIFESSSRMNCFPTAAIRLKNDYMPFRQSADGEKCNVNTVAHIHFSEVSRLNIHRWSLDELGWTARRHPCQPKLSLQALHPLAFDEATRRLEEDQHLATTIERPPGIFLVNQAAEQQIAFVDRPRLFPRIDPGALFSSLRLGVGDTVLRNERPC